MTQLTLEAIKVRQDELAAMIASFAEQGCEVVIPANTIALKPGEHYAGLMLGEDGKPSHHLILLPNIPTDKLNWKASLDWAKRIGGEIPTRREQSLLYANLKEQFEEGWYWSSEQHAAYGDCAWCQHIGNGLQLSNRKRNELRARAVRRLTI